MTSSQGDGQVIEEVKSDASSEVTPASALSDLVPWSKELPVWQQDALRRLYKSTSLSESDRAELRKLCRHRGCP